MTIQCSFLAYVIQCKLPRPLNGEQKGKSETSDKRITRQDMCQHRSNKKKESKPLLYSSPLSPSKYLHSPPFLSLTLSITQKNRRRAQGRRRMCACNQSEKHSKISRRNLYSLAKKKTPEQKRTHHTTQNPIASNADSCLGKSYS